MNKQDHPRKTISQPMKLEVGKPPRTVRQQLEYDAWTNHYPFARRMARHRRQTDAGQGEPNLLKANRSLSRQDRTLLAVSLVLLLLLLFARASAAQAQDPALAQPRAQESVFDDAAATRAGTDQRGLDNRGIEFRGDELPQLSVALDTDIKAALCQGLDQLEPADRFNPIEFNSDSHLLFGRTGEKLEGSEIASLLPVGSSVNLASFSSTSSGWKAQLVYSLATLFSAASLLWFSTPSRRVQAGGSPLPPIRAR